MDESTLDELSTTELRERAFALARRRHDLSFFWEVVQRLPHAQEAEEVDGSLGSVGPAIDAVVEMWHELTGHDTDYGDVEPLLRARFIEYLTAPEPPR
ncbi:hypothetical protein LX16_2560 [Stackebrandtia albiflava]|uniref:Uncharacterized protein n=1 Tax=Stackebrandtia albiflava TaxID=406432 RepID=A0A562V1W7_9ACTN|nr:hypothetical protein [Stackebrandtia albiflava]TWJ11823.1 hypothetical protein LX16_2560 [Stackebrandtia albiflava]